MDRTRIIQGIRWWHVVALVIAITGVLLVVGTAQQQDQQLRHDLLIKAKIAAGIVDPAKVETLNGSVSDLGSPDYQHLKEQMAQIRASDPSVRFSYLLGQGPQGVFFYVDSEPVGSMAYSSPGKLYPEASSFIRRTFSDKEPATLGPESDRRGTWVSAAVPVIDQETGREVALFGVDVDAGNWYYLVAEECVAVILVTFLFVLLVVIFGLNERRNQSDQQRLASSEEKFSRAFHTNPALMSVSSREDRTFIDVNASFLKKLGYTREDVIGKTALDIGLCPDPAELDIIQAHLKETGETSDLDVSFITKDKVVMYGSFSSSTIEINGMPCLLSVILDITGRKQAEETLRETGRVIRRDEKRLAMAEEIGHTGCWEFHIATGMIWGSAEAHRIFGFPLSEGANPIGEIEACIPEWEWVQRTIADQVSTGKDSSLEFAIYPADGSDPKLIQSTSRLERDQEGQPLRAMGVIKDITGNKLAENTLRRVNQKLNVLSQLTRQDLTNQIFTLNSYLELAQSEASGQDDIIAPILESKRAVRLIDRITQFTKEYQDLGVKPPAWQNVELIMLFGLSHLSVNGIRHCIETKNLEIFADPLLERAFQGLIENSLAHGGGVTGISMRYTITSNKVTLFFEDDGTGIPYEQKERIFLNADHPWNSVRGLFIIREIFDITGITIRETGEPGKGARFELVVPKGSWRIPGTGKE